MWLVAGMFAFAAAVYAIVGFIVTEEEQKLLVVYARAMTMGFLPWLAAYAGTRVLYGVEATLEN